MSDKDCIDKYVEWEIKMIRINNKKVDINHFPDGTHLLKEALTNTTDIEYRNTEIEIKWNYENNEELIAVYFSQNIFKGQAGAE